MRLSKEEYRQAEGCLKRYNYNCITIMNIRADIISIGAINYDSFIKAKFNISDSVADSVIKLQEDKDLNILLKEYKAVNQALQLVKNDCVHIFEEIYLKSEKNMNMWDIIAEGMSERTFRRRRKDLIYQVHKELKKLA